MKVVNYEEFDYSGVIGRESINNIPNQKTKEVLKKADFSKGQLSEDRTVHFEKFHSLGI